VCNCRVLPGHFFRRRRWQRQNCNSMASLGCISGIRLRRSSSLIFECRGTDGAKSSEKLLRRAQATLTTPLLPRQTTPHSWFIKMIAQTQMNRSRRRKSGPARVSPSSEFVQQAQILQMRPKRGWLCLHWQLFARRNRLYDIAPIPGSSPLTLRGILCRQPGPALFPTHSKTSSRVSSHSIF